MKLFYSWFYRKLKESAGVAVDGKDSADADIEDELL